MLSALLSVAMMPVALSALAPAPGARVAVGSGHVQAAQTIATQADPARMRWDIAAVREPVQPALWTEPIESGFGVTTTRRLSSADRSLAAGRAPPATSA